MRFRTRVVFWDLLDSEEGEKKTKELVKTEEREHLIKKQASNTNGYCENLINLLKEV